jgi:threonylcarbamoyladenosine tRNA methylthiotransferase MtaB
MKYSVITFGCRVNQADSLTFERQLIASGAEADSPEAADLVVVNTCSVTATADQAARQTIRRVARSNPSARIVVTGCYATRRPEEIRTLPNVAEVVANDDKPRLVSLVGAALTTAERFGDGDGSCGAAIAPGVAGRTAFTLCVQTGCAEPCSYCIIPATRGRPRSLAPDAILAEVDGVAAAGFKEVAITGVHLGSYGRDLTPPSSLIALLRALESRGRTVAGSFGNASVSASRPVAPLLFRISSLEPMDCTPEIVDLVASSPSFAPHFHLPLQHASDRMLVKMRRPYRSAHHATLVERIRRRIPDASIGSDVIVGFPGETETDIDELADFLDSSPLTHVHVFPYSDRPGTEASAMPDKVPGAAVRDRARRIRGIGERLTRRFRASQLGKTHRGLTIEDGSLVVTDNYLKVRIGPGLARNQRVTVRVGGTVESLTGEIV